MLSILRTIIAGILIIGIPINSYAAVNQVEEVDGSPSMFPWKVKFDNGSLTNNGDGTMTHSIAGGGASTFLTLDQSTSQTVSGGAPIFSSGASFQNVSGDIQSVYANSSRLILRNSEYTLGSPEDTYVYLYHDSTNAIMDLYGSVTPETGFIIQRRAIAAPGAGKNLSVRGGNALASPPGTGAPRAGGNLILSGGLGAGTGEGTIGLVYFDDAMTNYFDKSNLAWNFGSSSLLTSGTLGAGAITGTSLTDGTATLDDGSLTGAVNGTFSGTVQAEHLKTTDDLEVADDILLGSGSIMNWDSEDVTLTHASNLLTLAGGDLAIDNLTASKQVFTDANKKLVTTGTQTVWLYTNDGVPEQPVSNYSCTLTTGIDSTNKFSYWSVTGNVVSNYYYIVYTFVLPSNFASWDTNNAVVFYYWTNNASSANTYVKISVFPTDSWASADYTSSALASESYTSVSLTAANLDGTYTAGQTIKIIIEAGAGAAGSGFINYIGPIKLNYNVS